MIRTKLLQYLIASASVAVLAACGGGDDASTASSAPTSLNQQVTGLTVPTLTLTQSLGSAIPVVDEMKLAFGKAAEASALKGLGSMVPGFGSASAGAFNCTTGQIGFTAESAGSIDYTYANCSNGTYTFNGGTATTTVTRSGSGVVTGYQLTFNGIQVIGPGITPVAGGLTGSISCTPAATSAQTPSCTTTYSGYVWGFDAVVGSNGAANGTHQCDCGNGTWNVTFKDFTAIGGTAEVFGTNGSALVTRTGANTFTVTMYGNGSVGRYDVAPT
jgi:hypothetical protein